MTQIPPVYTLYFTNELGFEIKSELIIDATSDAEALEMAEQVLALNPRSAAALWADRRMIRQYAANPSSLADSAIRGRARSLRSEFRETKKSTSSELT